MEDFLKRALQTLGGGALQGAQNVQQMFQPRPPVPSPPQMQPQVPKPSMFSGLDSFIQKYSSPMEFLNKQFQTNVAQPVAQFSAPVIQGMGKQLLTSAESAVKTTPPYELYRNLTNKPISPQENVQNLLGAAPAAFTAINPAMQLGYQVVGGALKGAAESYRTNQPLLKTIQKDIVEQPGAGSAAFGTGPLATLGNVAEFAGPLAYGPIKNGIKSLKGIQAVESLTPTQAKFADSQNFFADTLSQLKAGAAGKDRAALIDDLATEAKLHAKILGNTPTELESMARTSPEGLAQALLDKSTGFNSQRQQVLSMGGKSNLVNDGKPSTGGEIGGIESVIKKVPDYIKTDIKDYQSGEDIGIFRFSRMLSHLRKNGFDVKSGEIVSGEIPKGVPPNVNDMLQGEKPPSPSLAEPVGSSTMAPKQVSSMIDPFEAEMDAQVAKNTQTPAQRMVRIVKDRMDLRKPGAGMDVNGLVEVPKGEIENPQSPFFNVNRSGQTPEARQLTKEAVLELKPDIEKVVGKPMTFKEVTDMANKTTATMHQVIGREATEQMAAAQLRIRNELAEMSATGRVTPEFIQTLIEDKSQAANTARLLAFRRINAKPNSIMAQLVDNFVKSGANRDDILTKLQGIDFNDPVAATKAYRDIIKPKMSEWVDLIRYNSMLSSPKTHINNFNSNAVGSAIMTPIEKSLTGSVDWLTSKLTGKQQTHFASEGPAYVQGYWSKVQEAGQNFMKVMRDQSLSENLDTRNIPLAIGGVKGAIYKALSPVTKLLEASDQLFQTLTRGGEEAALGVKFRNGVDVGTPEQMALTAMERAKRVLFRQQTHPDGQGVVLNAIDDFTNGLMNFRMSDNPITATIAKFTVPFLQTPMNIFKQGVEYGPLGFTTMIGAKDPMEQFGRALLGSSVFTTAAMLATSDKTKASYPTDPSEKNAFIKAGFQPWSIKIGDNWVKYEKLPPQLSFPLALVSSLHQAQKDKKIDDTVLNTVLSTVANFGNFFSDQSYVKNIGDLVSKIKGDPEKTIANFASNYGAQMVPYRALSGWMTRLVDDVSRVPDKNADTITQIVQGAMTQIPFLSKQAPARLDKKGNEIHVQNNVLNSLSPLPVTTEIPENKKAYDYFASKAQSKKSLTPQEIAADQSIPASDPNNIEAKMKKYQDLLYYPNVFNMRRDAAIAEAGGDLTKVDPLYTAPQQITQAYMRAQSLPPTDPFAKQITSTPDYINLSKARSAYFNANPIPGAIPSQVPLPSPRAQQLMDMRNFRDPEVQAYLQASTAYKNQQLSALGLSPLVSGGGGGVSSRMAVGKYLAKQKMKNTIKKAGKVPKLKGSKLKMPKVKLSKSKKPKTIAQLLKG